MALRIGERGRVGQPLQRRSLDHGGDGTSDVLWYGRGTLPDAVWFGRAGKRGATSFVRKDLRIDGYYQPQVADLIGDERDEVLWVSSSPSTTLRAWGFDPVSKAPRSHPLEVPLHDRVAVLADRRGPGHKDDLLLLGYGPKRVRFADDGSGATTVIPMSVSGPYQMVIGDWNGDRLDDIVWYAPGTAKDYRWDLYDDGTFRSTGSIRSSMGEKNFNVAALVLGGLLKLMAAGHVIRFGGRV